MDHKILGRDHTIAQKTRAHFLIVSKPEKLPLGEGFRHGKFHTHDSILVRYEFGKEKCSLVKIFSGAYLRKVNISRTGSCSLITGRIK